MIVADTGAVVALVDTDDEHRPTLRSLYEESPDVWVLRRAILPEMDYLLGAHVGGSVQEAFLADLADGSYVVE